ncbi:MAG: hypothetical protein SVV80_09655 [Planctomycetota bacterium]|nr:hypothetical protein [Planctomycetota bacterium]
MSKRIWRHSDALLPMPARRLLAGASGRRAFTLVETLAAGVILALSAVVLGVAVRSGIRSLSVARDYQRAAELLDRVFTKIDTIGPGRLSVEGPTEGRFAAPHDRFTWNAAVVPCHEGRLYEVTVRIAWQTPGGEQRSIEAQTLLNDPQSDSESEVGWDDL